MGAKPSGVAWEGSWARNCLGMVAFGSAAGMVAFERAFRLALVMLCWRGLVRDFRVISCIWGDHRELAEDAFCAVVLAHVMSILESLAASRGGRFMTLEASSSKSSSESADPKDLKELEESLDRRDSAEDVGSGGGGREFRDLLASRAASRGEAENLEATSEVDCFGSDDLVGGTGCPIRLALTFCID